MISSGVKPRDCARPGASCEVVYCAEALSRRERYHPRYAVPCVSTLDLDVTWVALALVFLVGRLDQKTPLDMGREQRRNRPQTLNERVLSVYSVVLLWKTNILQYAGSLYIFFLGTS